MNYKHGIYIYESQTALQPPIETTAGLQFIVGTAPINLLQDPYSMTNKITIAYSFAEACEKVGYSTDFKNYTLCQSIDCSFMKYSIKPIIMVNVLNPKKHVKNNEETMYQLDEDGSVLIETTGILKDTLKVTDEDGNTTYKQGEDYVATFDSVTGYITLSFFSALNKVKVSSKSIAPELVTYQDIIGGYDVETQEETGLELVRQVYPKWGLVVGSILAPGWSHIPEVCAVMEAKCTGLNGMFKCMALVDLDTSIAPTYREAKEAKDKLGAISEHSIVFYPKVKSGDRVYYMSAMAGALIASVDAKNEDIPSHSPSNKALKITAPVNEAGKELLIDTEQGNLLNGQGIVTAINVNGGWRLWGNRTACFPMTTDPKDSWINVRRYFNWHGNNFILTFFDRVDDPINYRLIEAVVDSENIRFHSLSARGHIAGGRIEFLQNENPITDIMNGTIRFHSYLAVYTPAQYIENILEFDPTILQEALFER